MFKKKKYNLQEVVKIVSDFVAAETEENHKIRAEFEKQKEAVFKQITDVLDQVKLKQKKRSQKVAELNVELAALIKSQNDLTDKLILTDDPVELTELEKELITNNTRGVMLETKITAFSNAQTFLTPEERNFISEKMSEYDSYSSTKLNSLLKDNAATFKMLKDAIPDPKSSLSTSELLFPSRNKDERAVDKLIKQDIFALLSNGDALELLKKQSQPDFIFGCWLSSKEDISFSEYIPKFIEKMRLETERIEREEQDSKLRERLERDERNAKAMAKIESRLGS